MPLIDRIAALLRQGRLDRNIEIPLPNEQGRLKILRIHSAPIEKHGGIDDEAVVKFRLVLIELICEMCARKPECLLFVMIGILCSKMIS